MNDQDLYDSGVMNPDEQAQWDYVTEMMAEAGEYDGFDPAVATDCDPSGDIAP